MVKTLNEGDWLKGKMFSEQEVNSWQCNFSLKLVGEANERWVRSLFVCIPTQFWVLAFF